jgi:hypothetical protein
MMRSGAENLYKKLQEVFPNGMTTISNLSKNTTDMRDFIVCDHQAFNFDLVKNISHIAKKPIKERTPDALFLKGSKLFFVEFKEGDCDKNEIRQKIYEGVTALFHFAVQHNIMTKEDFLAIDIGYAVINRYNPKGSPRSEVLENLERSIDFFNLKNIEGFIVTKTRVQFRKESILKLLNKITEGVVRKIEYVERNGDRQVLEV